MNIINLKKVLPILLEKKIVPFLWGAQGIGKTQTIKQLASELGLGFVHLHLATQDVGDLVGLLIKTKDGKVKHARPEWLPTEGKGIIFLDEANRMHPDVMQCMFSFVTEGTIHTHKLGEGWSIIAAGNYENAKFNVTSTVSEAAWISRFCHIDIKPSVSEFLHYADSIGALTVASFIRENNACLEVEDKEGLDKSFITPDRRAWLEMVDRLEDIDLGENQFEIYSGCVGTAAAASFISHKRNSEKYVSIDDVLNKYESVRKKVKEFSKSITGEARFDILSVAGDELSIKLEKTPHILVGNKLENLKLFLTDIPLELTMKIFNDIKNKYFVGKDELFNDKDFINKIIKAHKNEET
jgi:hypothetical protein